MGERIPRTDEVTGSNPVCSIHIHPKHGAIMKFISVLSLLLLASPAFAELTKGDLRAVIQEEIAASEKRTMEYIDLKIDAVNARIDGVNAKIDGVEKNLDTRIDAAEKNLNARIGDLQLLQIALIGLIAAAVAIPQIVIAYKERDWKEIRAEIQQLREKVEALQDVSS